MSDPTSDHEAETKPGPADPQREGAEAATPPGGPQRQDTAGDGAVTARPSGHDDDASANPAADRPASEAGGHTIALEDEQPGPSTNEQADEAATRSGDTLQFENAETSLDQPSTGVSDE